MRLAFVTAIFFAATTVGAAAAPPPPPPQFIDDAAKQLVQNLTYANFPQYSNGFAPDLRVFTNDQLTADSRAAWLAIENNRIGKTSRSVLGYSEGYDEILIVDQFDDFSGVPPKLLADPAILMDSRFITRAAQYKFGPDHLIHELRFVQAKGFWQTEHGLH